MKFTNIATIFALVAATAYASNADKGPGADSAPVVTDGADKTKDTKAPEAPAKSTTDEADKPTIDEALKSTTDEASKPTIDEATPWFKNPLYIGAGVVVLGALAGGAYMLVRKSSDETDL